MPDRAEQSEVLTATVRIAATPEEVFPYFVKADLLVQWIGTWADLEPVPGGTFALDMGDVAVRGSYLSVEPPERVVFTWGVPGRDSLPAGSTTVEVCLQADGDETIVELRHHDLSTENRLSHQGGWEKCLSALVDAVRG